MPEGRPQDYVAIDDEVVMKVVGIKRTSKDQQPDATQMEHEIMAAKAKDVSQGQDVQPQENYNKRVD